MRYYRAGILIMISLIMIFSKTYPQKSKNPILEKLDVKALLKKLENYKKDNGTFREGNVIINFFKQADIQHSYYLDYSEENLTTGVLISISGDERNGYKKEIAYRSKPKKEVIYYYPNVNIKNIEYRYSDKELRKNSGNTEYPIDYRLEYSEKGVLINSIKIGDVFRFSVPDVKKVIFKRDQDAVISTIEGLYDSEEPVWKVIYSSPRLGSCEIEINATSGNIISDYTHIKTVE